jgi:hypothetical protein
MAASAAATRRPNSQDGVLRLVTTADRQPGQTPQTALDTLDGCSTAPPSHSSLRQTDGYSVHKMGPPVDRLVCAPARVWIVVTR